MFSYRIIEKCHSPSHANIYLQKCFYTRETIDYFVRSVMGYLWKIFKLLPFLRNSSQWESKKSPEILYHHFWKDLIFPNKFKCETFFFAENIDLIIKSICFCANCGQLLIHTVLNSVQYVPQNRMILGCLTSVHIPLLPYKSQFQEVIKIQKGR